WHDSTAHIQSVTDTIGNFYTVAIGPTVQNGSASLSIYFAKNVQPAAAGANVVSVSFDLPASLPDVRIAEYRGIDQVNALEGASAATGVGNVANSGPIVTANAYDLLIGANYVQTGTTKPGAGFISRLITSPDGNILEDR